MTSIQASTLRPGLLVSLKTSVRGNVQYQKTTIETDHRVETGEQVARWETKRIVSDAEEQEMAIKARGQAMQAIRSVCSASAFGLLCPDNRKDELDAGIVEARRIAEEFNGKARLTRLYVNVIAGRIAPDDVEAVKAINSEVRDLLDDMQEGVKALDAKMIRDAANRIRSVGQMLNQDAQVRLQFAIDAARKTAREIVKAGEGAAMEIDRRALSTITESRTAFLDFDEATPVVAAASASGRAVDLDPSVREASDAYVEQARQQRQLDLT